MNDIFSYVPDERPDGSGIDDGPPLPRASIMAWKTPIILRLRAAGCTLRQIGEGVEMSHEGVRAVLRRAGLS